jgi:hypothetical protein
MRRSDVHAALLLALVATASLACVWRLDDEFLPDGGTYEPDATSDSTVDAEAVVATGCPLFPGLFGVASLAGNSHSLPAVEGGALWVVDQAVTSAGNAELPAAVVVANGAGTSCAGWSSTFEGAATTPSPLEGAGTIMPLDLIATSGGPALYYQVFARDPAAPLGLRALGVGIASSGDDGLFVLTSDLLWTPDRPAYGGSGLRIGDTLFVWGCKTTSAFDADCYVAQVPPAQADVASAHTYWSGDTWSSNVDDATPITSAGAVVSVRSDPTRSGRLLMTYIPPLGDTLLVRSSLAPQGLWSAPVTLAACDLAGAGPGAFCAGGEQHPELVVGQTAIAVTFDARSFTPDAGSAASFVPRLATFPVPTELP